MIDSVARLQRKRENGEDGFTLIELLVVVVIIGILMAIAVPLYLNYRKGANDKAAQSDVRAAISAIEQCNVDTGSYPADGAVSATGACKISTSDNTSPNYKVVGTGYRFYSSATNGTTNRYYCYSSATGGSVKTVDKASAPSDTCS